MTDNDIIKALECCTTEDSADCTNCPLNKTEECYFVNLHTHALALINRQKAEIERLEKLSEFRCNYMGYFLKLERDKAIKEFAEMVCEGRVSNDPVVIAVRCAVKEMTEGV